jgi:PAS domain S-box-containing protein
MSTPLRILLAGVNGLDTAVIAEDLRNVGYAAEIVHAGDREEAVGALGEGRFDVVVGECEHPADNGELVAGVLRSDPLVPVVLFSNDHDPATVLKTVASGVHDLLPTGDAEALCPALVRAAREAGLRRQFSGASEELRLFKTYFRNLFEHSPEAIVLLDGAGTIQDVNPGFQRLFQYEPDEVVGRSIGDIVVPQGKEQEFDELRDQVYKGRMVRRDTIRRRKDGSEIHVSVIGCPIVFSRQQVGFYAIYSDMTRRMKAIQALRQAESNYRNFFMGAVEGMYISTPGGRFVTVNPALAELLGYDSVSELTDDVKNIAREIYAEPSMREKLVETVKREGKVSGCITEVRRKDGETLKVCENMSTVRDDDGDLLYFQGTMSRVCSLAGV